MEVKILDLTRQYKAIQTPIEEAVLEQMRSGMFIGGKAVEEFESKFAAYLGINHAISVNSGTDALVIALKALGIKDGDEVITTPFTFFATAEAIAMAGATPVFVDVEEETYNIDPGKIEEKITERTKAILPVHIFGQPADMERIKEIANTHGLFVIEDACQAVGAEVKGKKVGTYGDVSCFSFFPTKNLGGFGDGGMIVTDNAATATVCKALKEHGMAQNGAKARYILNGVEDELAGTVSPDGLYNPYKYYNYLVGYNSRLDAIQARVLGIKLDYLDGYNRRRKEIADFYNKELGCCKEVIIPAQREGTVHVWHQYAFRCEDKDAMGNFLAASGIGSAAFYPVPLHLQKAFLYLDYHLGDLPVAEKLTKETVCLPIYPELEEDELYCVVNRVKDFYRK